MWKSGFCLRERIYFFPQGNVYKFLLIHRDKIRKITKSFAQEIYPHSTTPVDNFLQARIDVCCDIPNVILQCGVSILQGGFYFVYGMNDGGVVLIQLFTNFRCT